MNTFTPPPAVCKRLTGALLLTATLLALSSIEQSQAQLYIDIYPSQDSSKTHSLWVLSGRSQASMFLSESDSYIRHGALTGAYTTNERDTYELEDLLYAGPRGIGMIFLSTPRLFGLTNLSTSSFDYAAVTNFWASTNTVSSLASAAGTPTLSFSNRVVNGAVTNRSITHMVLYGQPSGNDWLGPRVGGGSNLTYGTNRPAVNWVGAGILEKPIGDFLSRDPYIRNKAQVVGYFGDNALGNRLRIRVHSATVPEPEEYALVFGLFALAFVIFRRCCPNFSAEKAERKWIEWTKHSANASRKKSCLGAGKPLKTCLCLTPLGIIWRGRRLK